MRTRVSTGALGACAACASASCSDLVAYASSSRARTCPLFTCIPSSMKVSEIFIEEGMHVKSGQGLARLDDAYATKSLQLAEAQAAQAPSAPVETRVRIAQAQLDYDRARQLTTNQIASKADLDRARAELDAQRAHLAALSDSLAVAQSNAAILRQGVDDTEIRAPFDGVVVSKDAQPGEMISPV